MTPEQLTKMNTDAALEVQRLEAQINALKPNPKFKDAKPSAELARVQAALHSFKAAVTKAGGAC